MEITNQRKERPNKLKAIVPNKKSIFQIWKDLGKKVPFNIRKSIWEPRFGFTVERIEIKEWPQGEAFGYPTEGGKPSNYSHLIYPGWKRGQSLPNARNEQWILVSK